MIFKVYLPKEKMLPMYASAPDGATALKKVQQLLGPLKGAVATKVDKVPDGETVV